MPTFKIKHFKNQDACSSGHFGFQNVLAFLAPQFVLQYLGQKIEEEGWKTKVVGWSQVFTLKSRQIVQATLLF